MMYVGNVLVSVLNGLGRGHAGFIATAVAAAGAAAIAVPLAAAYGFAGAAWGGIVPISAQLAVAVLLLRRVSDADVRASARSVTPAEPVAVVPGT
jgi:O-antigen/teichoic acid export membrane protein